MSKEIFLLINSVPFLLQGAFVTCQLAFVSIVLGVCGGLFLGIINSRKIDAQFAKYCINIFVWSVRGTPLFIQVLIVYYALPEIIGVSLSPFVAGVVALGVNSMAYISEIVRGGINAVPEGQWDAAYIIGVSPWQTMRGIILPQMFKIILPGLINELTTLVKETSILMVVGVSELTKVSKDIVARELDPMTIYLAAAICYLVLTSGISIVAKFVQKKEFL